MNKSTLENSCASQEAISHHYDLSNDFYSLWLDKTRTYSAAMFNEANTLEEAQLNKLDYHIKESKTIKAKRLLDIGCGWGSIVKRAFETTDIVSAVGLTLSEEQKNHCEKLRLRNFEVKLESWQDHEPVEKYDSIISIGAFEHFSKPELTYEERIEVYRSFFKKCQSWLSPGGSMTLQTIAYGKANRSQINEFILDSIFPESDLPYLEEIVLSAKGIFEIEKVRNDREDYANTFREWKKRLKANESEALNYVDKKTLNKYFKYQDLFLIGFHIGNMVLYRITLKSLS